MSNERIMIFTDDKVEDSTLINKLKSWGYNTYCFLIEPNEFSDLRFKPDLIIMDLNRDNDIHGLKLAVFLQEKFDVPFIYLKYPSETSIEDARMSNPYIFINKPINNKELKFAVEMAVYRDKLDKKLREDEKNFRILYENAPLAYQSLNKDGYLIEVNESWLKKLGYKHEEVIGHWFGDFLAPEYVEQFKKKFPMFMATGEISCVNFEMLLSNGKRITVSFEGKVSYDEEGNFKQTHCIFHDITNQRKAELALKESEQYYKTIFENTGTATIIVEKDSTVSLINTEFEKLYGYRREDIEGKKKWHEFVSQNFLPKMKEYHTMRRVNPESVPRNYEFDFIDNEGKIKNVFTTVAIIPGTEKSLVSLQDITDRNNTENQLKSSLEDKDMLLREIHHRVKNNLQIISSLLNLQSRYIEDEDALDVFTESQNRVRSMAIIHEKLYKSESMSKIDFGEYISDLTKSLFYNYRVDPSRIILKKKIEKIFFDVDTAIPCGLIINELLTNCLKHAFQDDKRGLIEIKLQNNGDSYVLNINDDGVGFPDDVDFRDTESLGMQLVNNLVKQIDGTIELNSRTGTNFKIEFRELEYNKRV